MTKQEEYMAQALELAREAAAAGEVPVGCVIVREGVVIGEGRNRREEKGSALSHAETEAIAMANLPIPSGPQKSWACAMLSLLTVCMRLSFKASCPTTSRKKNMAQTALIWLMSATRRNRLACYLQHWCSRSAQI